MIINPESMIKARIAETIVEEMFRRAGYQVYRFGYESVLHNFMLISDNVDIKNEVNQAVASMPDLIVIKEGMPHFIEVKYRRDGKLSPRQQKYWAQGRIMLVFPFQPYFKIGTVDEYAKTGELHPLEKDEYFNLPMQVIDRFTPLVRKYFGEDTLAARKGNFQGDEAEAGT